MGATTSKIDQNANVQTFVPNSQTKIDITDALVTELNGNNDTNYIRMQQSNLYIERKVKERLEELESNALSHFDAKLQDSTIQNAINEDVNNNDLTTKFLQNNVNSLNSQLDKFLNREKNKREQYDNNEARKKLVTCLRDNENKPLNCYNQFQEFKKTINQF